LNFGARFGSTPACFVSKTTEVKFSICGVGGLTQKLSGEFNLGSNLYTVNTLYTWNTHQTSAIFTRTYHLIRS